jgi:NAD-dependent SIR2 family protein deacetylase
MIGVICEQSFGFSKRGKCCNCGRKHNKEIAIVGEQDKYIKLCNECYKELKETIKSFGE